MTGISEKQRPQNSCEAKEEKVILKQNTTPQVVPEIESYPGKESFFHANMKRIRLSWGSTALRLVVRFSVCCGVLTVQSSVFPQVL